VRVEADGYQRAQSREIKSDEGNVTIDFELEPGENVNVTVMAPNGAPAAGAKAALGVAGSQINVDNGAIDDGSTYATRLEIGETGQLSFPQPDEPHQLVIAHPAGFAYLKSSDGAIPETLKLTPWARVEGVFKIGSQPVSGVTLNISTNAIQSYDQGAPNIFTTHETTTGADGSFVFERVMPGKGRIGRRILLMVDDGATEVTSSKMVPVELRAGETTRIELGGDGRPVIGKLAPPAGHGEKVLWNFAIIHASIRLPELKSPPAPADTKNDPERYRAWWNEWQATDEGKAWQMAAEENRRLRETSPSFSSSIAPDGSFRIDDMPAGEYRLSVRFNQHPAGQLMNYGFSVPVAEDGEPTKPVDLGVLTLEKVQQR
jgi:hypothetical protein